MLDEDFEYFLEKFGQPQNSVPVDAATLAKYTGKLPNKLLEYWQAVGFSGFADGLFWITNPNDYADDIYNWLEETNLFDDDVYHVIARSGFGLFYLWGEKNRLKYKLTITDGQLFDNGDKDKKYDDSFLTQSLFAFLDKDYLDFSDEKRKPLFERAVKKLGPLAANEIFGFEPALVLGGEAKLANLTKLDIHIHMAILKEFTQVYKMDLDGLGKILFGRTFSEVEQEKASVSSERLRAEGGTPCPKTGYWSTPAQKDSRRHFKQGEIMPNFSSDYGLVIWGYEGE